VFVDGEGEDGSGEEEGVDVREGGEEEEREDGEDGDDERCDEEDGCRGPLGI
jgi:hypothetical protein